MAARAVIPPGAPNWVTPRGLRLLQEESEYLNTELRHEEDKAKKSALQQRLAELDQRLASAKIIDLTSNPPEEIRFGATVKLLSQGEESVIKLVGADESDLSTGLISIHSPLAKALLGKRPGQTLNLNTDDGGEISTVILDVTYMEVT